MIKGNFTECDFFATSWTENVTSFIVFNERAIATPTVKQLNVDCSYFYQIYSLENSILNYNLA